MAQIIQLKRGTTAQWAASSVVLAEGEMGVELMTAGPPRFKFGNGADTWDDLPYPCVWPGSATLPVNSTPPAISGLPTQGQTLTGSDGTWTNAPTIYSRQWLRSGVPISGATNSTYVLQNADIGSVISFQVIASNLSGSGAAATSFGTDAVAALVVLPGAVTGVTAGVSTPDTQPLTWSAPTSGTGPFTYSVGYRLGSSSGAYTPAASGLTETSFTVTGLAASTAYDYSVSASNPAGSGAAGLLNDSSTAAPPIDSRPRFGVGAATAGVSTPAALLAAMTAMAGSANGGKSGTFTVAPGAGEYGWVAIEQAISAAGVTFTDSLGSGGWQGASSPGNNGSDPGDSPNTSVVTFNDGTTTWRFFRQSYAAAGGSFTAS